MSRYCANEILEGFVSCTLIETFYGKCWNTFASHCMKTIREVGYEVEVHIETRVRNNDYCQDKCSNGIAFSPFAV